MCLTNRPKRRAIPDQGKQEAFYTGYELLRGGRLRRDCGYARRKYLGAAKQAIGRLYMIRPHGTSQDATSTCIREMPLQSDMTSTIDTLDSINIDTFVSDDERRITLRAAERLVARLETPLEVTLKHTYSIVCYCRS